MDTEMDTEIDDLESYFPSPREDFTETESEDSGSSESSDPCEAFLMHVAVDSDENEMIHVDVDSHDDERAEEQYPPRKNWREEGDMDILKDEVKEMRIGQLKNPKHRELKQVRNLNNQLLAESVTTKTKQKTTSQKIQSMLLIHRIYRKEEFRKLNVNNHKQFGAQLRYPQRRRSQYQPAMQIRL